ncbi:MAG: hypothetical protein CMI74_00680 [Candidatus Pelagibacter sp.]|nr:hypothetical protein [Candidatus Pelagibacter sp.]
MILKYVGFLIGLTWSYSLIKTESIFSKKAGLIFKLFISKVSWLTFLAAVYFGYKNFSIEYTLIGIVFSIILVHLGFLFLSKLLKSKFTQGQLTLAKIFFEYSLLAWIVYYLFI